MDISRKALAQWEVEDELDTCKTELGAQLQIASDFGKAVGGVAFAPVEDPLEQVAATVAGCFDMILSGMLAHAGHPPTGLDSRAEVEISTGGKPSLSRVLLILTATVPGIPKSTFDRIANEAMAAVARSLGTTSVALESTLSV